MRAEVRAEKVLEDVRRILPVYGESPTYSMIVMAFSGH